MVIDLYTYDAMYVYFAIHILIIGIINHLAMRTFGKEFYAWLITLLFFAAEIHIYTIFAAGMSASNPQYEALFAGMFFLPLIYMGMEVALAASIKHIFS